MIENEPNFEPNENEQATQVEQNNKNVLELTQEEFNNKKDDLFTFITPQEFEHVVCSNIWDDIVKKYKNNKYNLKMYINNSFIVTDSKYVLCRISANVNNKYDIKIHLNSNVYQVKNINDAVNLVTQLDSYFTKLKELHKYVKENYYLTSNNDLSLISIYDDLKWVGECCACEGVRESKYFFDCDEQNYLLFDNDHNLIKSFKTISELNECPELQYYKNKCRSYYCC